MDNEVSRLIMGVDHVEEYYHELSCEQWLGKIQIPSLFVSNKEDPVCYKENIPIDTLFRNDKIITLITDRGGHVEYICGKEERWWGFEVALKFFEFFNQ